MSFSAPSLLLASLLYLVLLFGIAWVTEKGALPRSQGQLHRRLSHHRLAAGRWGRYEDRLAGIDRGDRLLLESVQCERSLCPQPVRRRFRNTPTRMAIS